MSPQPPLKTLYVSISGGRPTPEGGVVYDDQVPDYLQIEGEHGRYQVVGATYLVDGKFGKCFAPFHRYAHALQRLELENGGYRFDPEPHQPLSIYLTIGGKHKRRVQVYHGTILDVSTENPEVGLPYRMGS